MLAPYYLSSVTISVTWAFQTLCFCRAAPAACGGSQARGRIGTVVTGLHHSHSHAGSKPVCDLHHSSRQCWPLNPLSEARDQICILVNTSQICSCHDGNSIVFFVFFVFFLISNTCWALYRHTPGKVSSVNYPIKSPQPCIKIGIIIFKWESVFYLFFGGGCTQGTCRFPG